MGTEAEPADSIPRGEENRPVDRLIHDLLEEAYRAGASDVHLDPRKKDVLVRTRVDGRLVEASRIPTSIYSAVVSAFRRLVGIDESDRRPAVRGRAFTTVGDVGVDVRVSTYPTVLGPALTVHLIPQGLVVKPIDEVYPPAIVSRIRAALEEPYGMVLAVGPAFSGKSTLLYALLLELMTEDRRVMTIEDPVMFHFERANQAYVTDDFTVADGLRAIHESDADVALASDLSTVEEYRIAFEMSHVRHVLTALHAEDAAQALAQLLELGAVPAAIVAEGVVAIVGQRLVRKSCSECQTTRRATPEEIRVIGLDPAHHDQELVVNLGCDACEGRGSAGRVAVAEVLTMTPGLRAAISRGARDAPSLRAALGRDFRTTDDCLRDRVLAGEVTIDEAVLRLAPKQELSAALEELVEDVSGERPDLGTPALDGTVTIVFTDLVDSTELTVAVGDEAWMEALRQHQSIVRKQTEAWGGVEVKSTGDGFMLAFPSSGAAVRCALAVQDAAGSVLLDNGEPLGVKIGLHAGEPIRDGDDFYGTTVNVAARVASAAAGGEVLVTRLVRGLISSSKDFEFGPGRDVELKGVDGAQTLYPVTVTSG